MPSSQDVPQGKISASETIGSTTGFPYVVRVTADVLNVRMGPGAEHPIRTTVRKGEAYTIVEESGGWGRLKSGAGWIDLRYTKRR